MLIVAAVCIFVGFDEAQNLEWQIKYGKAAGGIVLALVCVAYRYRYSLARSFAYDIKTEIHLYPSDRPHRGTIELQLFNRGDSDVVISYAGFIDYRWEETKNILGRHTVSKVRYCEELSDPALERRFPIYIQKGDIATLEFSFNNNRFEGEFYGLFYVIDLEASEKNNLQAQRLPGIKQDCDGAPAHLNFNYIRDKRLHSTFVKRRSRRHRHHHS